MEAVSKVFKSGNSSAMRLPKAVVETLALKSQEALIIEIISKDEFRVRKMEPAPAYPSVKELFDGYRGDYRPEELSGKSIVGRELI